MMSAQVMNEKPKAEKPKDGKNVLALQRAQSAVLSRDYALAIRLYGKILTTEPDNLEVLSKLGFAYVRAGKDEKALKIYLMLQKKKPTNFDTLNSLGGIYRRLRHYEKSIEVLEKALQSGGNVEALNYNMGFTYKLMGKYNEAAECFKHVIDANSKDVLAYNHLGCIEDLRGNHVKAQSIFSRGLQIDPNHPILHYNAALSYTSQKKYEQAKKHFQAALRAKPGWDEVMDEYARLLGLMNNKDEAKKILKQAVTLNPTNIKPHINLGDFYTEKAEYPKAEKSYISALEIDSENRGVSNSLAGVYEKQNKNTDAVEIFDKLEKLDPDDNRLALRYAKTLLSLGRLDDAMLRIEKVQNKEPNNIDAFNVLAQYLILNGEKKKAQDCLKYIKQLEPNVSSYLVDNAEQFSHIGDFSAAEKLLREHLEKKPNDSRVWAALGSNHKEMEQYKDALLAWQRCLELDKENTPIFEEVVGLSSYFSSDPEAMEIISKLVNSHSDASNLESIESVLAARENALKNADEEPTNSEQSSYRLELGYFEEEEEEEGESFEGLRNLDISSEGDFPDDYDPLILEESEEETTEEDENEHFDLSSLVSSDEPRDFDPQFEKPDLFGGKDSKQYDPIEEQEYLGIDGFGFEDDDIVDEDDDEIKTIPLAKSPMIDTPIEEPPAPKPPAPKPPAPPKPSTVPEFESEPDFVLSFEDEPGMGVEMEKELTTKPMIDQLAALPLDEAALPDMTDGYVGSEEDGELLEQADLEDEVDADDFDSLLDYETPDDEVELTNDAELDEEMPEDEELLEQADLEDEVDADDFDSLLDYETPEDEAELTNDADIDLEVEVEPEEIITTPDEILMGQVKKVLKKSFSSPPMKNFNNPVEMFDLLRNLCTCLPDEKKDALFSNLDNAKLNYVVDRLSGKPGLLAAADAFHLSGEN